VHHYGNDFCFTVTGNEAIVEGFRIPGKTSGFEYDSGESYSVGNTVLHSGSYYQCNTDTTGTFDAGDWDLLGTSCTFGGVFVDGFNQACGHSEIKNIRGTGGAGYGIYVVSENITPVCQWLAIRDSRWSQCGHAAHRLEGNCLEVVYAGTCQFTGGCGLGATSSLFDLGTRPISPSYDYRKGTIEVLCSATAADTFGAGHPSRIYGDWTVNGDNDQMMGVAAVRPAAIYVSGLGQCQINGSVENPYPAWFFAKEMSESNARATCTGIQIAMKIFMSGSGQPDSSVQTCSPFINTGGFWGSIDHCGIIASGTFSGNNKPNGVLHHISDGDGNITGDLRFGANNELAINSDDLLTSTTVKGNYVRYEEVEGFSEVRAHSGTYRYAAKVSDRIWIYVPTSTWELSALSRRRSSYRGQFVPDETVIISSDPALNDGAADLTIRHDETDPDTAALGVGRFILSTAADTDLTAETDKIKFRYDDDLLAWVELWRNF
jgi:hypothetical protein